MVEALTVAKAAKRMEIRPETAKRRLQRLRARLKRR
jgi:DNA-directed RNA polymerase specialized sigma24 family protein